MNAFDYSEFQDSNHWYDMVCPDCGLVVENHMPNSHYIDSTVACPDCKVFMDYSKQGGSP